MSLLSGVKGLLFAHNTSPQRLAREAQMGGAPMPSIAVTKEGVPFNNFGDITLVGDPRSFDPSVRANKAFSSDAYTVRAPSPVQMARKGAYKKFADDFAEYKDLGATDQVKYALEALERKGGVSESSFNDFARFFEGGPAIKAKFLDELGVDIRDASGKIDRRKVNEAFTGRDAEFNQWSSQQAQKYVEPETYFISNPDRDYVTGRPKLVEYTADNVADWMAKRGGKNQESGLGQTGVAAQRASESRQLKSLDDIKALRESVVDEETLDLAKQATEDRFFDLAERLKGAYKYDSDSFRYLDEVGEMIIGMTDRNAVNKLREFGFEDASPELVQEIQDYRKMLQDSPVGYMESKPERVVQLDEYAGAVVPENIDAQTRGLLEESGLEIRTYDPDVPETRTAARDTFRNQMFQVGGIGMTGLLGASALMSPEAEAGAATQFIRLLEAGYPESTARKIMSGELPMDEASRMARAREQGFTMEALHAGNPDIKEFNPKATRRTVDEGYDEDTVGSFFTDNPVIAASYSGNDAATYRVLLNPQQFGRVDAKSNFYNNLEESRYVTSSGEEIDPVYAANEILGKMPSQTDDFGLLSRYSGDTGVIIDNVIDMGPKTKPMRMVAEEMSGGNRADYLDELERTGAKTIILQDPSKVRSYYSAAFDPDEIGNPNIMASPAPVGAVGGLLASEAVTPEGQLNPLLAVPAEIGSALNEAVVGTLDFIGPDTVNAVSELIGSEYRMPRLSDQELVRLYSQGGYMDEGYGRDFVRTATGLLQPF